MQTNYNVQPMNARKGYRSTDECARSRLEKLTHKFTQVRQRDDDQFSIVQMNFDSIAK